MNNKYFLSRDSVEAAKKLLDTPADGSEANKQARINAITLLEEFSAHLLHLIEGNDNSPAAVSMKKELQEIDNLFIQETDGDDNYGYAEQGKSFD